MQVEERAGIDDRVESTLENQTLEQKIGQKLIVGFPDAGLSPGLVKLLTNYHIGGVILFGHNIESLQR